MSSAAVAKSRKKKKKKRGRRRDQPLSASEKAERETRALIGWANSFLGRRSESLQVEEIGDLFVDGTKLIVLVEEAFGVKAGPYNKKPQMTVHSLENFTIALKMLDGCGVRLLSCDAHMLLSGNNDKTYRALLYNTMNKLSATRLEMAAESLQKKRGAAADGEEAKRGAVAPSPARATMRAKLLAWIRSIVPEEALPEPERGEDASDMSLLSTCRDGMVISHVVKHLAPDADLDLESLSPYTARTNLASSFEAAEAHLGVPSLLEPEDFEAADAQKQHEASLESYLCMLLSAGRVLEQHQAEVAAVKSKAAQERESQERAVAELRKEANRHESALTNMSVRLASARSEHDILSRSEQAAQAALAEARERHARELAEVAERTAALAATEEKLRAELASAEDEAAKSRAEAHRLRNLVEDHREREEQARIREEQDNSPEARKRRAWKRLEDGERVDASELGDDFKVNVNRQKRDVTRVVWSVPLPETSYEIELAHHLGWRGKRKVTVNKAVALNKRVGKRDTQENYAFRTKAGVVFVVQIRPSPTNPSQPFEYKLQLTKLGSAEKAAEREWQQDAEEQERLEEEMEEEEDDDDEDEDEEGDEDEDEDEEYEDERNYE